MVERRGSVKQDPCSSHTRTEAHGVRARCVDEGGAGAAKNFGPRLAAATE